MCESFGEPYIFGVCIRVRTRAYRLIQSSLRPAVLYNTQIYTKLLSNAVGYAEWIHSAECKG